MTLTEALANVGTFVGGSAVLLTAVSHLLKKWFELGLSRDLENHKAALDRATQAEAARLSHELEIAAADVVKRTTLLNERRATVIADLYSKLVDFHGAAEAFAISGTLVGGELEERQAAIVNEKWTACDLYFKHNRIYFSEKLCAAIDALFVLVNSSLFDLQIESGSGKLNHLLIIGNSWKAIKEQAPLLLRQIETEFRELLGVKNTPLQIPVATRGE